MESIEAFLSRVTVDGYGRSFCIGSDDGCGDGSGNCYRFRDRSDYGFGCSSGKGYSNGIGCGDGDYYKQGDCYGYGTGIDILSINNFKVHFIDHVPTVIYSIKGNIARGAILRKDMTLEDCYVAKVGNYFAHGDTARKAYADAKEKAMLYMSVEERIDDFYSAHSDCNKKYPFEDLFRWHNILTNSCELGRREWCKERGITNSDSFTVAEFCELTKNAYGGEVIRKLIKKLKNE